MGEPRITLAEAAALLGYRSTSTLRSAIIARTLPAERMGARLLVTTETAVREWERSHAASGRGGRGKTRPPKETQP